MSTEQPNAEGAAPRPHPSRGTLLRHQQGVEASIEFGKELRRRRINKGYRFLKRLVEDMGDVSLPYMSQIEKGFRSGDGRPVFLADDKLHRLSELLDWPMADMYRVLGRLPETDNVFALSTSKLISDWQKTPEADRFRVLRELMAHMATEISLVDDGEQ